MTPLQKFWHRAYVTGLPRRTGLTKAQLRAARAKAKRERLERVAKLNLPPT